MPGPDSSEPALIGRLRAALQRRQRLSLSIPGYRESAVLLPLVHGPGQEDLSLLLTVRHHGLPTHPGQIAFPGGKRDPADPTLEATALREAREELGLRSEVRLLGQLDDVPTPAGFVITPVVGVLRGPLSLLPNEHEVTEVFYAPLRDLPAVHREGSMREFLGVKYVLQEYLYDRWRIWGATASMIRQLLSLV